MTKVTPTARLSRSGRSCAVRAEPSSFRATIPKPPRATIRRSEMAPRKSSPKTIDAEERRGQEHRHGEEEGEQDAEPEAERRPRPRLVVLGAGEVGPLHLHQRLRQQEQRLRPGYGDAVEAELLRGREDAHQPLVGAVVAEVHRVRGVGADPEAQRAPGQRQVGPAEALEPGVHVPGQPEGPDRLPEQPGGDRRGDAEVAGQVEAEVADDVDHRRQQRAVKLPIPKRYWAAASWRR